MTTRPDPLDDVEAVEDAVEDALSALVGPYAQLSYAEAVTTVREAVEKTINRWIGEGEDGP